MATQCLGHPGIAARAILFDKTAETNWSLAWHQDRTICVRERIEVKEFGPWSFRAGLHHVTPPFDLLARMVTLCVHLDDVPATNAPLLIALGPHTLGKVPVGDVEAVTARCSIVACLATAGDIWAYSTPILHTASFSEVGAAGKPGAVHFSQSPAKNPVSGDTSTYTKFLFINDKLNFPENAFFLSLGRSAGPPDFA